LSSSYWRIGMMGVAVDGIIGREAEGKVVALGPGTTEGLKIGDRVGWLSIGAYAEYTAVPDTLAYPIPADIEPGITAASLMQGLTAMSLIHKVTQVKKGDWVLVHAAAGGVGLWLCQLLSNMGVKVIGTASTAEKLQLAKDNGASHVLNYKEEGDLVQKIQEITGEHGVDIVFDGIGKDQTENNVNAVANNGMIVTYGAAVRLPLCDLGCMN
jgi:NADPH2:quinone reductase